MKKIFTGLLSLLCLFSLTACGEKQPDFSAKALVDSMIEEELVRAPMEIDETMATETFHINLEEVEDYGITLTGISPGYSLIVVAKAKEGKVENVKASVEQILKDRIDNAFYPMEQEAASKASVRVDGNYVSLFILDEEQLALATKMLEEQLATK